MKWAARLAALEGRVALALAQGQGSTASASQTAWYVDAVHGNDSNGGFTAPNALKTNAGLIARWRNNEIVAPLGGAVDVFYLADPTDPLILEELLFGGNITLTFHGQRTFVRSGTFTATTVRNEATNTAWSVTDPGVANWTSDVGQLVVVTSGANAGMELWPDKDTGGGSARVSWPCTPQPVPLIFPTFGTVSPGDKYSVFSLTRMAIGQLSVKAITTPGFPTITFRDFHFLTADPWFVTPEVNTIGILFSSCRFDADVGFINTLSPYLVGCDFENEIVVRAGAYLNIVGGRVGPNAPIDILGGTLQADGLLVRSLLWSRLGGTALLGNVAFFDCAFPGAVAAIEIGHRFGVGVVDQTGLLLTPALWGSGNTGQGINVHPGGTLRYTNNKLTLTGVGGDIALGGVTSLTMLRTDTFAPVGPLACTWANLLATYGAGGFNGTMINPVNNAAIYPYV